MRVTYQTTAARLALALLLATSAGCEETPTTPTGPVDTRTSLTFSTTLPIGGSAWRSFKTARIGPVTARLTFLSPDAEAVIELAVGTFDGTTCTVTTAVQTAPTEDEEAPQISRTLAAGTYCVRVADLGNLTRINTFGVVVVMP
jgi:hypothetical protein